MYVSRLLEVKLLGFNGMLSQELVCQLYKRKRDELSSETGPTSGRALISGGSEMIKPLAYVLEVCGT